MQITAMGLAVFAEVVSVLCVCEMEGRVSWVSDQTTTQVYECTAYLSGYRRELVI